MHLSLNSTKTEIKTPQNTHSYSQNMKVIKMGAPTMMILRIYNLGANNLPTTIEGVGSRAGTGFNPGGISMARSVQQITFFLSLLL